MGYPVVSGSIEALSSSDSITQPLVVKVKLSDKIKKQMDRRNWTEEDIEDTVKNPHATSEATNRANDKEATAYFNEDGTYVVKENETDEIIQISNRKDPNWVPDATIKTPYFPSGRGTGMTTDNINSGSIKRGGIQFYDSAEAIKQIAKLKANNTIIYGIDAFKLTKTQTQPVLEHSMDFGNSKSNWDQASTMIESKAKLGLMFEIVADEDPSSEFVTSSFIDKLVYAAMLNFLEKHNTEDVKTLLNSMQLNSNGMPSNDIWLEWQQSLEKSSK